MFPLDPEEPALELLGCRMAKSETCSPYALDLERTQPSAGDPSAGLTQLTCSEHSGEGQMLKSPECPALLLPNILLWDIWTPFSCLPSHLKFLFSEAPASYALVWEISRSNMCRSLYRGGRRCNGKGCASPGPEFSLIVDVVTMGISFSPIIVSLSFSYLQRKICPKEYRGNLKSSY